MKQISFILQIFLIPFFFVVIIILFVILPARQHCHNAMYSKSNAENPYEIPSDYKDVEKNNKRTKKNKTEHSNHPKKNPPLTERALAEHVRLKEKMIQLERSHSKSKQKSPHKPSSKNTQTMKPKKKINTTPIKVQKKGSNTERKKSPQPTSKQRSVSTSRKNTSKLVQKDCNQLSPLNDTKRQLFEKGKKGKNSPNKLQVSPTTKLQASPTKGKKTTSKQKKKVKQNWVIEVGKIQQQPINVQAAGQQQIEAEQCKIKIRRQIPQIRTQFSSRKKSNIDDSLFNKLEIRNQKCNKDYNFIESRFVQSVEEEAKMQGSRKERLGSSGESSKRRLDESLKMQSFRKQQEKKWSGMLEQIKGLKNEAQIGEKIDLLIMEITENYNRLKSQTDNEGSIKWLQERQETKGDEQELELEAEHIQIIVDEEQNASAVVQKEQLRVEEPRSNIISLDDFFQSSDKNGFSRLKRDLFETETQPVCPSLLVSVQVTANKKEQQKVEVFPVQINQENKPQSQIKKIDQPLPLEPLQKADSLQGKKQSNNQPVLLNTTENIQKVVQYIESNLITQFCSRVMSRKRFLHSVLSIFESQNNDGVMVRNDGASHLRQPSCNNYACHLLQRLLDYLFTNDRQYILKQISYYYQCKPLEILRYVRSTHLEQQEEELSYEIENEKEIEIPFFNLNRIEEFQLFQLGNSGYVPSYFGFNQCVYDAFNDIIDKLRPYGSKGKPIFTLQLAHALKHEQQIRQQIFFHFHQILQNGFDAESLREEMVHGEEGNFEIIYFVSLEVMESVYNEAVLELWRITHRPTFQL